MWSSIHIAVDISIEFPDLKLHFLTTIKHLIHESLLIVQHSSENKQK